VQKHDPIREFVRDHALGADRDGGPWLAGEMPATAGPAGPAGAEIRGAAGATVRAIAAGHGVDAGGDPGPFRRRPAGSVRPSPANPDWGGPGTILNIGMNAKRHARLAETHGETAADALYLRFVQAYAIHVARLDPDVFDGQARTGALREALRQYEVETDEPFPQDPAQQLSEVLRSMARAWEGTSARLCGRPRARRTKRRWAGRAGNGAGHRAGDFRLGRDPVRRSGHRPAADHRALSGPIPGPRRAEDDRGAVSDPRQARPLAGGCGAGDLCRTGGYGATCRARLREEMQIEFTIEDGRLAVLDAVKVQRSARAGCGSRWRWPKTG
jgi:pyruvate,orthophosphate dikinase